MGGTPSTTGLGIDAQDIFASIVLGLADPDANLSEFELGVVTVQGIVAGIQNNTIAFSIRSDTNLNEFFTLLDILNLTQVPLAPPAPPAPPEYVEPPLLPTALVAPPMLSNQLRVGEAITFAMSNFGVFGATALNALGFAFNGGTVGPAFGGAQSGYGGVGLGGVFGGRGGSASEGQFGDDYSGSSGQPGTDGPSPGPGAGPASDAQA